MKKILVINTGSTSTKLAVFEDDKCVFDTNVAHSAEQLAQCKTINDQYPMRKAMILDALSSAEISLGDISAVAARGGTFGMVKGGAYLVEESLLKACRNPVTNHPSNLSAIIAADIAESCKVKAYIYDAVCVNEITDIARVTGLHDIKRRPFSHTLNTRAVARSVAESSGRSYEELNIICSHLGGGISANLHSYGRIIDLISDDEGPMSPERAGGMNGQSYVNLCYSGEYTKTEMMRRIKGRGGLIDHLGTADLIEVERRIDAGDEHARFIFEAMTYQISKAIASLGAVVCGDVDCIILTGGAANSVRLTEGIRHRVSYLAPVTVVPGGREMEALAEGVIRVLEGREAAKIYEAQEA